MSVAELARRPLADLEAGISLELDRIQALSEGNPLAALAEIIEIMQGINLEILKCQAPMLIENAHQRATESHAKPGAIKSSREESMALASMFRTEEAIVKLGVAQAKVRQEIERNRESRPAHDTRMPRVEQHALPPPPITIEIPIQIPAEEVESLRTLKEEDPSSSRILVMDSDGRNREMTIPVQTHG